MDSSSSSYCMGDSTLEEIEKCEKAVGKNKENDDYLSEDSIIETEKFEYGPNNLTLKNRMRLASQRQCEKRKLLKSQNATPKRFDISSISRYLNPDSLKAIDFTAWENSIEKLYSPAVQNSRKSNKFENTNLDDIPEFLEINAANVDDDINKSPVNERYDNDDITFMLPQKENHNDLEKATQFIDDELLGKKFMDTFHNESVINKSGSSKLFSQNFGENKSLLVDIKKDLTLLTNWNLPLSITNEYKRKGVEKMFQWQCDCLQNSKVLFEGENLVYSAPTSSGKTLVSEILMIKNILERKKKVLFILPFVSIVREKIYFLQDLLSSSGLRVDGYFSGYQPAGGFDSLNLVVCTIEKANSIVNRLLEQNKLDELGMIVIDEVHLISDPSRGYILELLLTKILYMCLKYNHQIQLIAMSATLPNVDLLCKWLKAEFYTTDYRPIELKEMIKIDKCIYDNKMKLIRQVSSKWNEYFANDADDICELAMETIIDDGSQIIIFCPSKDWCEQLSTNLARGIYKMLKEAPILLENVMNKERLEILTAQSKSLATGIDQMLERCIKYGCAFHHAGLTTDERDLVEMAFKEGIIKVLVATSTLSSGVNLPARRVIIRSPMFGNKIMSNLTYRQMIGRAGRKGKDVLGESVLVCSSANARMGKELISIPLKPITSSLHTDDYAHLKRALLEIIAANVANTRDELELFLNQTLYCQEHEINFSFLKETSDEEFKSIIDKKSQKKVNDLNTRNEGGEKSSKEADPIRNSMNFLLEYDFIRLHSDDEMDEIKFVPTRLGIACLTSAMPPKDGFMLLSELQKARQNFVLECDLHAIYLVTPFSVAYQLQQIDWTHFIDLYDKLPEMMKRVGKMVGVSDTFLIKAITGRQNSDWHAQQVHKRFYTALALQELVNEEPIMNVSQKYKIPRGLLQSLQQSASTFAAILTNFCQSLQWNLLVLILQQFRERLYFGIHPDLIDLMKIPSISSTRVARALYNGGIQNLTIMANSKKLQIEDILLNAAGESGSFFISGKAIDMTVQDIAKLLITDAQAFVKNELGIRDIKWCEESRSVNEVEEIKTPKPSLAISMKRKLNGSAKTSPLVEKSPFVSPPPPLSKKANLNASMEYKKKLRSSIGKLLDSKPVDRSDENLSLFQNSEMSKLEPDDISNHFDVIDVLSDREIYETFEKQLNLQSSISLAIGVQKTEVKALTIGGNLLKSVRKADEKFNFMLSDKLYISCICICMDQAETAAANQVHYLDLQSHRKINLVDNVNPLVKKLLNNSNLTINMFDARANLKVLQNANIEIVDNVCAKMFDTRLGSWILDPDNNLNWNDMVAKFAPTQTTILDFINQQTSTAGSLGLNHKNSVEPRVRTSIECILIHEIRRGQLKLMEKSTRLLKVLENLELPIQIVLAKMENKGFPVNKDKLYATIERSSFLLRKIENFIYRLNGRKFDLTSSKEVAKVVGIHRNLEKKKISTAKTVLAKIDLPIAESIMTYRTLATTLANIQPMTKLVKDNRIYGRSFSLTQTGRISMYEPNLQNVTKDFNAEFRDENDKLCKELVSFRSVFQCSKGKVLLSADFCQLELRILTHLCRDPKLIEIMRHIKEDIFRKIAAKWNKINEPQVTDDQRSQTKQLCYGIIYGMGNKALAEKMCVSEEISAKITDEFHRTYPFIRRYTEQIIKKAKEKGFIETVTCRRRYLPSINSDDSSERSKAERQALNSTIQGSASDLVKNAILRMEKNIKKKHLENECQLVLHLHDELFYEVSEMHLKDAAEVLNSSMVNCVTLNVPLMVKIKCGSNWGELKEIV